MPKSPTKKKIKKYNVSCNVFFTQCVYEVEASNKKEAFQKAKGEICHGMGEEVTLFEVEEIHYKPLKTVKKK